MIVKSYRDLDVWKRAMDFVVDCYRACERFPKMEMYGLCSQLQRSAVSIPANNAEGHGRNSTREFLHHLSIAYGSLMESETHLQIAERLRYLDAATLQLFLNQAGEIGRILNGVTASLQRKLSSSPWPLTPGPSY